MTFDPNPQTGGCSPLLLLLGLVFGGFLFFGIASSSAGSASVAPPVVAVTPIAPPVTTADGQPAFINPHVITAVDVRVLESAPPQVEIAVTGYLGDGCEFPTEVRQSRQGSTITVEIFRVQPLAAMCPAVIVDYAATIRLDGTFEPGTYTVNVNGIFVSFSV